MKRLLSLLLCFVACSTLAQSLTVESIMRDPKWIGVAPSGAFWGEDSRTIYFNWNPSAVGVAVEKMPSDSLYHLTLSDHTPRKVPRAERLQIPSPGVYNRNRTQKLFEQEGDLFLMDLKTARQRQLTNTVEPETAPAFNADEARVTFRRSGNLFSMTLATGEVAQLTNFLPGKKAEPKTGDQERWLKTDQLALFDVLRERKTKREATERNTKAERPRRPKEFYLDERTLENPQASPDGRFVTFRLLKAASGAKSAAVPNYVTETGFTEDLTARTKVGAALGSYQFFVYDVAKDTIQEVSTKNLPGLADKPDYVKDYQRVDTAKKVRSVVIHGPVWSPDGKNAVVIARSLDNKDRWILALDPATRSLKPLDRQRDEAWVGGPGIAGWLSSGWTGFLADNETVVFHSEASGYSHLYAVNVRTGEKNQLTSGTFEVQQAQLSRDRKTIYFTTNEVHPGEQNFYRMAGTGGARTRLTNLPGGADFTLSPDETQILIRNSVSNRPWELFVQPNQPGGIATQLTQSLTPEFKAYPWREPQLVRIKASDGADVYARLYVPEPGKKTGAAVVFVHGAGYLQNAHKWWSQYFREYLFHNLLVEKGYTVLDLDYRASAGYGRDWRTGIYRHMGGKDLSDNVDGANWLVQNQGIDAKRIGIYGGSYGGFITLMALFTKPGVFAAGAALRPVTDWAAYNHPYTSAILNEPQTDSLAYRRSSPIYHAAGLTGQLLICHGMVDVNVHFQDVVRLTQRLIELKKENWELAPYPVEDHAFTEPSSWTDEYKRILKLFDETLAKKSTE
ncbi:MAG: prolyl oligopeptidase family serine peptidase [Cytophagaceae bacterium]|nr:prolyl oligopeptidase family serine peptidase [Cytophagaceae bacterium]